MNTGLNVLRAAATTGLVVALAYGCTLGPIQTAAPVKPVKLGSAPADPCATITIPDRTLAPITMKGDAMRSGWYPNQPALNPAIVSSPSFGRLFKTTLTLQPSEVVLAQPLVFDGTVFVVTEGNNVYALDDQTGAIQASRALGPSFDANEVMCADLPLVGITGTPVIDPATGTGYFFSKTYKAGSSVAVWYAHAVDVHTLAERPNFPIEIAGPASNDPTVTFDPMYAMQRPGLLLMDGVVYAAFGAHCDQGPYHGYVVGIGEQGGIVTMFATEAGPGSVRGAGIWQTGGGIVSDGPGRILFTTGNGYSNGLVAPVPGKTPPGTLEQSLVLLDRQPDGSLQATDFFAPYDVAMLDAADLDFGSAGPMGLPDCYGTPQHPHLAVAGGKPGDVYLIDRDDLGGFKEGPNEGDAYVSVATATEGMWANPAQWPGDGRWVYITPKDAAVQAFRIGVRTDGVPTLAAIGHTSDSFGFFSGTPLVTSDGITSGSAVLWITYTTTAWADGALRAYSAVPDSTGNLTLLYEDAYGKSAKFQLPGVGDGRLYVGTSDGSIVGYGTPTTSALAGPPLDFGTIIMGQSVTRNAVLTAAQATQVTAIASQNPVFSVGAATPALPATLAAGATLTVPVTFAPVSADAYVGALAVMTSGGEGAVSLKGMAQAANAKLRSTPTALRYGGIAIGDTKTESIVLSNVGATPYTFGTITPPRPPFSIAGAPTPGQVLASGESVTVTVAFAPPVGGTFSDSLDFGGAGALSVYLSGTSAVPSQLVITPETLEYGGVGPGSSTTMSFTLSNPGGEDLTITKSKPPALGVFVPVTALPEGSTIAAGASVTEQVTFAPTTIGEFDDQWVIGSSAGGGTQYVTMHGLVGDGTGLSATYFSGTDFQTPVVQRVDPTVNFNWGTSPPAPGVSVPGFSVRWTGQVEAVDSETYTFQTNGDDGTRLWVDDVPLIDAWTNRVNTADMGTIALVGGQLYDIRLEHYNGGGPGQLKLQWSSPSTPLEVIPSVFLYPSAQGSDASTE